MAWKRFIGCNAFFILVEVFIRCQEEKNNPSGLFPMQEVEVFTKDMEWHAPAQLHN